MMPNFIIIGAARAGTTSVYHYLRQHPQIGMSAIKETNFFAYLAAQSPGSQIVPLIRWPVTSLTEYQALFNACADRTALGEATPFYIFAPGVPELIQQHIPDVRLVALLRNPVERAYSAYIKHVREGFESRPFEQAVEEEIRGAHSVVNGAFYYLRSGLYCRLLTNYLACFDRAQLQAYLFDDLQRSPAAFMRSLFAQLGVDPGFVADTSVRYNRGYLPWIKNSPLGRRIKARTGRPLARLPRGLYASLMRFQDSLWKNLLPVPGMPPSLRLRLRDYFAEDILNLQALIGRDLRHWLEVDARERSD